MQPAKLCPQYVHCSVNNCPLDPGYPNLFIDPADKEKKCPMEKGVRLRIAAKFPGVLKMEGRTSREWLGMRRWEAIPLAVKTQFANQGAERLKAHRKDKSPSA